MSPTCARVSLLTRTRFLTTKKPGPHTLPPGVLSPFLFLFLLSRWECQVLFQCSGTPERRDEHSRTDISSPTQRLNRRARQPLDGASAWNQHIPVCASPPILLPSAGADLEKDASNMPMLEVVGTPSSTSVVLE